MNSYKLNNKKFGSNESKLTGRKLLNIANLAPAEDYELLYKINEKGFEPIQLDEEVDLRKAGIEGFYARPYRKISIDINGKKYQTEESFMTPIEVMKLADVDPDRNYLKEIRKGKVEVTYKDDIEHKIAITRNSSFITIETPIDIKFIVVNAKQKEWSNKKISFEEVVKLAYGEISSKPNIIYTINYINGVSSKPEGSMLKGDVISVKNKMIFNATRTDKS